MSLKQKIDFALIFSVKNANPNGDPLNGNRPRTNYDGYGEVTDVCLKRKIRDRLLSCGHDIFIQSDENKIDGLPSLKSRAEDEKHGLGKDTWNSKKTTKEDAAKKACKKWFDVRSFGQVFAFGKSTDAAGVSIAIRGPVTIQSAFSIEPISITSTQITKSVSGEGDGSKKGSDTMGMKHRVDDATYVTFGSMSPQLAEKTEFSDADAAIIKDILSKLFEGDASSARPDGSMSVKHVVWWQHNSKSGQYSSAKVHQTLRDHIEQGKNLDRKTLEESLNSLNGLKPEVINGF